MYEPAMDQLSSGISITTLSPTSMHSKLTSHITMGSRMSDSAFFTKGLADLNSINFTSSNGLLMCFWSVVLLYPHV